jgi:hypothetical protein
MGSRQAKTVRNYNVENDLRRRLDGVRLHPLVGYALIDGGRRFFDEYPHCEKSRWDFARSAIPIMQDVGVIELIDPKGGIPKWLPEREQKLAHRGGLRPIWMPTFSFPGSYELWDHIVAGLRGDEIVWTKEGSLPNPDYD